MSSLKYFKILIIAVFPAVFLFVSFSTSLYAQTNQPKALKLISKEKQLNAFKYLKKVFEKDSLDPEYYYSFSLLYSIDTLPFYNLDTAYLHVVAAINYYKLIEELKTLEKLQRDGIDSISLKTQKERLQEAAFKQARLNNSEKHYNYYLNYYQKNIWSDSIIALRNKKAFETALEKNTYVGYRKFIETYPNAHEIDKARYRFERLYFDESTSDQKLSSYVNFLHDHPKTHYRNLAEKRILELTTLSGSAESFLNFIDTYKESKYVALAKDFIFHIDRNLLSRNLWNDSLINISKSDSTILFPFYKFQKFGFNSINGNEIISAKYDEISSTYLCAVIMDDFLLVNTEGKSLIANKSGAIIWEGNYEHVNNLGSGLLTIKYGSTSAVIHKSGKKILDNIFQEVKLLNGRIIGAKKEGLWGLYSLMGIPILAHEFDNVASVNNFIILTKNKKHAIINSKSINLGAENKVVELNFIYDNYQLLKSGDLLVRNNKNANVLSTILANQLPLSVQEIKQMENQLVVKDNANYQLFTLGYQPKNEELFSDYIYNHNVFFYKKNKYWHTFNDNVKYDSTIVLSDKISLGMKTDTIVFFMENVQLKKPIESVFRIIRDNGYHQEKQEYLVFTEGNKIDVYNIRGKNIFTGEIEKITAFGSDLIVIQQNGKKGVIDSEGIIITPIEMDAIGNFEEGSFSILDNSKFGIHSAHGNQNTSINPEYQRALKRYNSTCFIAYKEGHYGLINNRNTTLLDFEYEEIRFWNDTSALVKQNYQWQIFSWKNKKPAMNNIKDFNILFKNKEEIILKILIDNNYGVVSSTRGIIVPATYNDIIDIGTGHKPLYLAERNIEEADFYVTIYYNESGNIVYKQAYEAIDYQKIVCDMK